MLQLCRVLSRLFVQLPTECLLYLNRTELSADSVQNCLLSQEKHLTSCQAPYPFIPSFNLIVCSKLRDPHTTHLRHELIVHVFLVKLRLMSESHNYRILHNRSFCSTGQHTI
jgi:hypothetical protein